MTRLPWIAVFVVAFAGCERSPAPPAPSELRPVETQGPPRVTRTSPLPQIPPRDLLVNVQDRAFLAPDASAPDALTPPSASSSLSSRGTDGKVLEFPLQHTRVSAQVSGNVARVELTQLYQNPSPDRLEAIYAFPLPPNAAVTDMYFRIGDRIVYSEVKRKAEARRTYEAARAEGKTAALTEQERPNLFTQSVANIPPGETVAVVLRYVHEVPYDHGRYVFHVPTTIGPRYIPASGVPDATRITPPVVGPGYRSAHDVDITVRLSPGPAFDRVASRNHRVVTGMDGEGGRLVALSEDDRIPNKDFVLSYSPAGAKPRASALVEKERGEDYLMLFVQPPVSVADDLVRPKELVFLLDKSGSMMGQPIEAAKALVSQSLKRMGPQDTFQIVAFDGAAYSMSPAPLPNTAENVAAANQWLSQLSGGGGTEMMRGIVQALSPSEDPSRLRMVVFCTDAFIGNEYEILSAIRAHRGSARVFAFGIGSSVNRYLIEGMAREGRGAADYVSFDESPEAAVQRLYLLLDRPVLTDLSVSFEGMTVSQLYPEHLPDLFAGQPLVVIGKYQGSGSGAVVLQGKLGNKAYRERIPVEATAAQGNSAVLGTLWGRRKIETLMNHQPGDPTPDTVEEIVALGLQFKLVTQYTSFVAVERRLLADPGLPLTTVLVPNELPAGVKAEGIFGEGAINAAVLPNRVKPGDPELRISAPRTTAAVRVRLPFEFQERDAEWDARSGEFVLRFLVPSGWPDGSYDAQIAVQHLDGRVEQRTAPIRVDTAAPAVQLTRSERPRAGERFELRFKPTLSLTRAAALATAGRQGGAAEALKAEIDVKEVLVRAPWGEIATARMEGALGEYVASLSVPSAWPDGNLELEIVASDAAGNVRRSVLPMPLGAVTPGWVYQLGIASLLLAAIAVVRWRRLRRRSPALIAVPAPTRALVDTWS